MEWCVIMMIFALLSAISGGLFFSACIRSHCTTFVDDILIIMRVKSFRHCMTLYDNYFQINFSVN